jgi:hypothetical protein
MSSIISLKFSDKVQWFYFPFSPFFKSMAVGQDGEAMDRVQSHAEVERKLNTGVVIPPLQNMVAKLALDQHPVLHVTQIHVQVLHILFPHITFGTLVFYATFNNIFQFH